MINAVIFLVFAACGAMFVFGTRRTRALLALFSIFIANLEFEVGIGLNLPVLLTILSMFLLLTGQISIHPRATALFSNRMFLFLFWVFGVWLVGFLCLDVVNDAQYGWTRSSTVKPIIQLIRFVLLAPLGLAVADGIRSKADMHWFLKNWTRIAVISALYCFIQVGAHKFTGTSLGTYRAHQNKFHTPFAKVAGMKIMRANGLAGEPKAQGMAMAMSMCMLFGTLGRGLIPLSRQRHILCIGLMGTALLLTFSSGAIAMTAVLIGLVMLGRQSRSAKRIAATVVLFTVAGTLQFTVAASSLWESRLQRIVSISTDVHGNGWGMDKERPAMIYLLEHPHFAITGIGIGMGPYHFDHLIADRAFRGKYVDPNSGLLWGLYGFGVIGWVLLLAALKPELFGSGMSVALAPSCTLLMRFILLYFFVYTPLWWLMIGIGVACAPAAQRKAPGRPVKAPPRQNRQSLTQRKMAHAA
jgi:hypothetical protein